MRIDEFTEKMKGVEVFETINLSKNSKLIKEIWKLYLESFPKGYATFVRDFSNNKEFQKVLADKNYIKFVAKGKDDKVLGFALISSNKKAIEKTSATDTKTLKIKNPRPKSKIFWIFIFIVKGKWRNASTIPSLVAVVFKYIFDHGGIAGLSSDLEKVPTAIRQIRKSCKLILGIDVEGEEILHEVTSLFYPKK